MAHKWTYKWDLGCPQLQQKLEIVRPCLRGRRTKRPPWHSGPSPSTVPLAAHTQGRSLVSLLRWRRIRQRRPQHWSLAPRKSGNYVCGERSSLQMQRKQISSSFSWAICLHRLQGFDPNTFDHGRTCSKTRIPKFFSIAAIASQFVGFRLPLQTLLSKKNRQITKTVISECFWANQKWQNYAKFLFTHQCPTF